MTGFPITSMSTPDTWPKTFFASLDGHDLSSLYEDWESDNPQKRVKTRQTFTKVGLNILTAIIFPFSLTVKFHSCVALYWRLCCVREWLTGQIYKKQARKIFAGFNHHCLERENINGLLIKLKHSKLFFLFYRIFILHVENREWENSFANSSTESVVRTYNMNSNNNDNDHLRKKETWFAVYLLL